MHKDLKAICAKQVLQVLLGSFGATSTASCILLSAPAIYRNYLDFNQILFYSAAGRVRKEQGCLVFVYNPLLDILSLQLYI